MMSSVALRAPSALTTRPACATSASSSRTPRRAALQVVAIGQVNDPEKTKKNKEEKAKSGMWAEPSNNNPLEKKTIMRGDAGKAADQEGENPVEGAKKAVEGVADAAKDAVDSAKKAVSGKD